MSESGTAGSHGEAGGQGGGTGGGQAGGGAEENLDLLVRYTHQVIDRYADRARRNLGLARDREYGLADWLDDVRWFWSGVADDTTAFVDRVRGFTGGQGPGTPGPDGS